MASISINSAVLRGAQALPVSVELSISGGIPGITIVGLADTSVQESRSRVRSALKAAGFKFPSAHIVVNLSPGDIRKSGPGFDLPIALGILLLTKQVSWEHFGDCLVVGELSLDGKVKAVRGMVAFELLAQEQKLSLISGAHPGERLSIEGVDRRVARWLSDFSLHEYERLQVPNTCSKFQHKLNFAEVAGQKLAKRALVLAAVGNHSLLMTGSPGSGKTMLAARLPGILPRLSAQEQLQAALMHSICGQGLDSIADGIRPFRAPHHSISLAGLVGGGRPVMPGELSLAHTGVLFLDELSEFKAQTLQALRQPLEAGKIKVVRLEGAFDFPSQVQLIAASNPCPCGYLGDKERRCICSEQAIVRYQAKMGGPLMDRIDMAVELFRPSLSELMSPHKELDSQELYLQVQAARSFKEERNSWFASKELNSDSEVERIKIFKACQIKKADQNKLNKIFEAAHLSARSYIKVLRLARSIADLDLRAQVELDDVYEALAFKPTWFKREA